VVTALCYNPEGRGFDSRCGDFSYIYLILPAALCPGVYPASNRNESTRNKQIIMYLGSKERRVRRADNLTAIYEPIV
jgi:hypothetical protein